MNPPRFQFEVCANGVESCLAAQAGGADRVELCAGIPEGGTTPSFGDIATARSLLDRTRLHVIIRPRGGDFRYSPLEERIMLEDIANARRLGADGVVLGCLTIDGAVDLPLMGRLMKAAQGMSVTFHRAFDVCRDPFRALEDIIGLGCHRILTSGQQPTAEAGIPLLRELQKAAAGRITLLAGCGVNEGNIARIARETLAALSPEIAERKIVLLSEICDGVMLMSRYERVTEIFGNIIRNAIRYNREGGSISVLLTREEFTVSDTGIGIAKEDLGRIFDRFFTVDKSHNGKNGGFGLGLSVVKKLCGKQNWQLTVESEPGKGSTFRIGFLPAEEKNNHKI